MDVLFLIILSTFSVSLISFIGALAFFLAEKTLNKLLLFLVAFSAGGLLGGAFFHLMPESLDGDLIGFLFLALGFCSFFVLENFINWHHHHAKEHPEAVPFSYLILVSDAIHNFIDGLMIAASFIVSFPAGIATSLAVAFHEIPQEIGDYAVLIYGGFSKKKALLLNFFSALTAMAAGVVGFFFFEKIGGQASFLLPFAAGSFIYIAASDLIPEIKKRKEGHSSLAQFLVFLTGLFLMLVLKLILK
jgi:zinc and cadmium transporter